MIAKRAKEKSELTGSFTGLAKYILRANKQEKIAAGWITNCGFDDYPAAINEINATQALNRRGNENAKTYHLVVSFPAGEKPSIETLKAIEADLCKKIGLGDHQRICAVHDDTDHYHVHIAINKVNPKSHNLVEPYYDKKKLVEAAKELEIKYDLRKEIDWENPKRTNQKQNGSGNGIKNSNKASDMEAHTGTISFHEWLKNQKSDLLPKVQLATNWQDLHKSLAKYDLTIRKRANGFIISSRSYKAYVKASDFDRSTSLKQLEDRLGTYQEPEQSTHRIQSTIKYTPLPKQKNNSLWENYQNTTAAKKTILNGIKAEKCQTLDKLYKAYITRRETIKKDVLLNSRSKKQTYQLLKKIYEQERWQLTEKYNQQLKKELQNHPYRNWQDWLMYQSLQGDNQALKILRKTRNTEKTTERFAFWSEQEREGMTIFQHLHPKINKQGDLLYQVGNTQLRDNGRLHFDTADENSIIVGLRLARQKYGDHLDVKGDAAFKQKVVEYAVASGMNISFADKEMETKRQLLETLHPHTPQPATNQTKPKKRNEYER